MHRKLTQAFRPLFNSAELEQILVELVKYGFQLFAERRQPFLEQITERQGQLGIARQLVPECGEVEVLEQIYQVLRPDEVKKVLPALLS